MKANKGAETPGELGNVPCFTHSWVKSYVLTSEPVKPMKGELEKS